MSNITIDLTNKTFGEWTVLGNPIKSTKRTDYFIKWHCKCSCGVERYVRGKTLLKGLSKSCGHMRPGNTTKKSKEIFVGVIRGYWTVKEFLGRIKQGNKSNYWLCECKCGKEKPVAHSSLVDYKSKGCGCTNDYSYLRLKYGDASFHLLENNHRKGAIKRGLECTLTREEFYVLFSGDCFYCGRKPEQVIRRHTYFGEFLHNGIDRIDSSKGYILGNVRSCCKRCNFSKHTMGEEEFYLFISQLYNNLKVKGLIAKGE